MVVFPSLPCRVIDPRLDQLFDRGQDDQPDVFGEALQCLHAQISREISKRVVNKKSVCVSDSWDQQLLICCNMG